MRKIAFLAEYDPSFEPHVATNRAIEHSCAQLSLRVGYEWVSTENISEALFRDYSGLWVAPGSPYRNMNKTIWAIQVARESGVPIIGTCGGFQHIMLEYARNVIGIQGAAHAEYDPYASDLFIAPLSCSLAGRSMILTFIPGSKVAIFYGSESATEKYYCNFSVNPVYIESIKSGPMRISGSDSEGELRVVEYLDHPFFIGTLFVPQARSRPESPHPLISAFVQAVQSAEQGASRDAFGAREL